METERIADQLKRAFYGPVEVTESVNFPPVVDVNEMTWKSSVAAMEQSERALREAILRLPEARLDEPVPPTGDSVYVLLQGAAQHALYHAGQISLLSKAAAKRSCP